MAAASRTVELCSWVEKHCAKGIPLAVLVQTNGRLLEPYAMVSVEKRHHPSSSSISYHIINNAIRRTSSDLQWDSNIIAYSAREHIFFFF